MKNIQAYADYLQMTAEYIHEDFDKDVVSDFRRSMSELVRKFCDRMSVTFVSKKALEKSKEMNVNLFEYNWQKQSKFDKGRKIFHLEHKFTVSDMVNAIIESPSSAKKVLKQAEFGWILKDEDAQLNSSGYFSTRECHDSVYDEVGIEIIHK